MLLDILGILVMVLEFTTVIIAERPDIISWHPQ